MARLKWDQTGERHFETGVDRGVLYLSDGTGVAWNGLTGVEDQVGDIDSTALYFDGVKYFDDRTNSEFSATLKAFTYPDEFAEYDGLQALGTGGWMFATEQPVTKTFGLSYRTRIGNDIDGTNNGYKLHVLYNLVAVPNTRSYSTLDLSPTPTDFQWILTGVPVHVAGIRPAVHFIMDSTKMDPILLKNIEDALYGTDTFAPRLPSVEELMDLHLITITDNGDGTWTAEGPEELLIMETPTQFRIEQIDATYLDADTYQASTTQ